MTTGVFMTRKKTAIVILLFLVVHFLPTQEIDKTLYQRIAFEGIYDRGPRPDFIEYFKQTPNL